MDASGSTFSSLKVTSGAYCWAIAANHSPSSLSKQVIVVTEPHPSTFNKTVAFIF